jgi:hypothetical protein
MSSVDVSETLAVNEYRHSLNNVPQQERVTAQLSNSVLVDNPLLARLRPVLSEKETRTILKNRGVPELRYPESASVGQKIAGLANIATAYWPTSYAVRFGQRVLAQVHASLALRNPEDVRYVEFVYEQSNVLRGGKLRSAPEFLGSMTGSGFILAGPSGSGKTAFLQRLRVLIGNEPCMIQTSRGQFSFLPVLILRWPDCGTLAGLLSNLRHALIGELGIARANEGIFSNIVGSNGTNAAIATCIVLSLGLLVIDGFCLRSIRAEYREILDFISTFKERTGIPTLLTCTYPALQVIARGGSKQAHLGSTGQEYWDLEPPGSGWEEICSSFWKLGYLDPRISMPQFLPELLWDVSRGNMRILTEGYTGLHQEFVYDPMLVERATKEDLLNVLEAKLRLFKEPLTLMAQVQKSRDDVAPDDLRAYGDYLPYEVFSDTYSAEFERLLKLKYRGGSRR